MTDVTPRSKTYTCLVGHHIPEEYVERDTETRRLDSGAIVQQCKEHGAPIAVTISGAVAASQQVE
jgi:hypothetical protein